MSDKYEKLMASVEEHLEESGADPEVVEAAIDAMSFVAALNQMFKDNGAPVPEEPDMAVLENYMDGVHGELAAACLFLSEKSFAEVPKILRAVSSQFEKEDVQFTDPDGYTGPSVPFAVRKGFSRLADRLEATMAHKASILKNINK